MGITLGIRAPGLKQILLWLQHQFGYHNVMQFYKVLGVRRNFMAQTHREQAALAQLDPIRLEERSDARFDR